MYRHYLNFFLEWIHKFGARARLGRVVYERPDRCIRLGALFIELQIILLVMHPQFY